MFLTVVRIFPHADETDGVMKLLSGVLGPTRVQPGCLGCSLAAESDPEAVLYVEAWQSEGDLRRRLKSVEYEKILGSIELSAREPEVWIYDANKQEGLEYIARVRIAGEDGSQGDNGNEPSREAGS